LSQCTCRLAAIPGTPSGLYVVRCKRHGGEAEEQAAPENWKELDPEKEFRLEGSRRGLLSWIRRTQ
jgi:hypothetical protein